MRQRDALTAEDAMSLQYYPHEDLELKSAMHPGNMESGASDYVAIAIIDMVLVMALVSFASSGGVIGMLVVLGLIAGFNLLALSGRR
jgi:hypothetical protein